MSLLLPVQFPRDESIIDGPVQGLAAFDIVLFGYWTVPDGVDPATVREEHAAEAEADLYELAAQFSRAGASTEVQLHFGPGGDQMTALQTRITEETDADAILLPDRITPWNNVLVPLRDDRNAARIIDFLSAFDPDTVFTLELFHAAADERAAETAREMLDDVADRLLDRGFSESDLEVRVDISASPETAIIERANNHNVVVIGETEERADPEQFIGPMYRRIGDLTDIPVVVVRNDR
jgi:nucleotide-binding universal stress UspA family protein